MKYFALKTHTDQSIVFEGIYQTFIQCIEDAVSKNIDLSFINLANQNLTNANLDDAHMPNANFIGANLTGANLSESNLKNSNFVNAELYNTCLAHSKLVNCDFRSANFGATLIEGCDLSHTKFSSLSSLDLDFTNVSAMHESVFQDSNGLEHAMSQKPIIFKGLLHCPIAIFDHTIAIGTKTIPKNLLPDLITLTLSSPEDQPIKIKG